jgi:hypothetical protein
MRRLRSKCLLCDGARDGNRYVCWCPASYARAFKIVDQPKPAIPHSIRHIFVGEQSYPSPAPVIIAGAMTGASVGPFGRDNYGNLRGDRPPDDGRLDFSFDDEVKDDFLPDMFGMFKDVTDLRSESSWG